MGERFWFLRRPVQLALDIAVLCGAFFLAYLLRFDFEIGEYYFDNALNQLPFVVFVQFVALFLVGTYSIIWRYVSLDDIRAFLKAALISAVILILIRLLVSNEQFARWQVPLSIILIDTGLAFAGLLTLRLLRRFAYEFGEKRTFQNGKRRFKPTATLFVGAGRVGALAVRDILGRADAELDVKGFIDDDRRKKGGSVGGIKVLGTTDDLARLVGELSSSRSSSPLTKRRAKIYGASLIFAAKFPSERRLCRVCTKSSTDAFKSAASATCKSKTFWDAKPSGSTTKICMSFLTGKIVMVTGAGGSIGSELVRQITGFNPKLLLLIERNEYVLFQIERELSKNFLQINFLPLIADIGDESRMREIFAEYKPSVVFHAAAHKHVPLMEKNPTEAIKNNVLATKTIGELAGEAGVKNFVLIFDRQSRQSD
jgi:FlaA1/EpsC-like NDP-sugar epimerase